MSIVHSRWPNHIKYGFVVSFSICSTFESHLNVYIAGLPKNIFTFRMLNVRLFATSVSIIIMLYTIQNTEYRITNTEFGNKIFSWINNFICIPDRYMAKNWEYMWCVCTVHTRYEIPLCENRNDFNNNNVKWFKISNEKQLSHRYWVQFLWCLGDLHALTRHPTTHIQLHYSLYVRKIHNRIHTLNMRPFRMKRKIKGNKRTKNEKKQTIGSDKTAKRVKLRQKWFLGANKFKSFYVWYMYII